MIHEFAVATILRDLLLAFIRLALLGGLTMQSVSESEFESDSNNTEGALRLAFGGDVVVLVLVVDDLFCCWPGSGGLRGLGCRRMISEVSRSSS